MLAIALLLAQLPGQAPEVEIAFVAEAATSGLPAISWLCGTVLPTRPEWPSDLQPGSSFVVRLGSAGLRIAANSVALPDDTLAAGSMTMDTGRRALFSCLMDGSEDWFVDRETPVPPGLAAVIHAVRGMELDRAHTIDLAVAVGHLLGATVTGDSDRDTLQLGAALCGHVTWQAWHNEQHLRVRGRSDGGLFLPAILVALASTNGNGAPSALPLRAFIGRDGDREEAVRQMARPGNATDLTALHAMLYGDDELRLTAIDTLTRLGEADELPRIVNAAAPALPLTTVAAMDAVTTLWGTASEATRRATKAALARSSAPALRALDPEAIGSPSGATVPGLTSRPLLLWLLALAAGLFTFWLRERARLSAFV
ncbi:MAG: hypothetical protein KDC98_12500 [Planctomycetes bacterium]|nr:hypothetical protein [Planctomycetota bacterium]